MDKTKEEALRELLRLLADDSDIADRITITIRPKKSSRATPTNRKSKSADGGGCRRPQL